MSPQVIGVLHHGGLFDSPEDSIARGLEIVSEGADIVDVADDVPALEAVVAALSSHARVSIHTTDPIIAASALEAGATIVNDMSASLLADRGRRGRRMDRGARRRRNRSV